MDASAPEIIKKEPLAKPVLQQGPRPVGNKPKSKVLSSIQKYVQYAMYFVVFCMILIVGVGIFSFTDLGKQLIKSNLSGQVTSVKGEGIAGAIVKLDDLQTKTDINGYFSFNGLDLGSYQLTVEADGFASTTITVDIAGGIFGLMSNYDLSLEPEGKGYVIGKIIVPDNPGYNFADDTVLLDGQPYELLTDGQFRVENLVTKTMNFRFKSANYTDVSREVEVKSGENSIGEFEVQPAGDIIGSITSYVKRQAVTDLKISAEGISQDQIEIEADNQVFRINDMEIGREYQIRVSHPLYVDRDYTQTVEQGESALFNYELVESGFIAYLDEAERDVELFISEYDGKNKKQLTDGNFEPYAEYFDPDGTIYFLSTRDRVNSALGGQALLAYAVNTEGGNPQRITTNTQNLGQVYPNFEARQLINLTSLNQNREDRLIQVMDLKGEQRQKLFELPSTGEIYDLKVSEDGKFIAFGVLAEDSEIEGLYLINVDTSVSTRLTTKIPVEVLDISANGSSILYSARNPQTDLIDLFVYTPNNGKDTKIVGAYTGSQYQFVGESTDDLIFFDTRQEDSNVFHLNISSNTESKLTNFTELEGVEALYQQREFILYQTNNGLYVMDFDNPIPRILVTRNFARYTGFDF